MINVVDEVLIDNPKYRIYDNNGNVLYDNVSIELVTPVQVQGTPINKALFDSIKYDFDYPVQRFFNNVIPVYKSDGTAQNVLGNWSVTPIEAYSCLKNNDDETSYYEGSYDTEKEILVEVPKKIKNPIIRFKARSISANTGKILGYNSSTNSWVELYTFGGGSQGVVYEYTFAISDDALYTKFKIVGQGVSSSYKLRIYYFGVESGYVITG